MAAKTPYTLKSPCADCPFRSDIRPYLSPARAQEIADDSCEDSNFYCHKTVDYSSEDGQGRVANKSRVCAGFLVTMEKEGRANQPTRIAERLGIYDRSRLDMDAPTHPSMRAWVLSHAPEADESSSEELEHCGVVSNVCMDPAGYRQNGAVFDNPEPPTCSATCGRCEDYVCAACTSHSESLQVNDKEVTVPICVYCNDD